MGYRLAGFRTLGGVEIDPDMMELYRWNVGCRHSYEMPIQEFKHQDLPNELHGLDVLDGSPPCSSFSMAGARERDWGKEKQFREGQAKQVLDDLFFHFIDVARLLKPKVVVAENVKGLILGNAKAYVARIFAALRDAGYETQLFLLNSASMGVPQSRERTFFLSRRKDLGLPAITLDFRDRPIPVVLATQGCSKDGRPLPPSLHSDWLRIKNESGKRYTSTSVIDPLKPSPTLTSKCTSSEGSLMHWEEPRKISAHEAMRIQTFPEDYQFKAMDPGYVIGMSVPPRMMERVASQVRAQWLDPLQRS